MEEKQPTMSKVSAFVIIDDYAIEGGRTDSSLETLP